MSRLPVPVIREGDAFFERLGTLSSSLARETRPVEQMEEYAQLQALCAHAYQLRASEFEHVLGTFPLIPTAGKGGSTAAFNYIHT